MSSSEIILVTLGDAGTSSVDFTLIEDDITVKHSVKCYTANLDKAVVGARAYALTAMVTVKQAKP